MTQEQHDKYELEAAFKEVRWFQSKITHDEHCFPEMFVKDVAALEALVTQLQRREQAVRQLVLDCQSDLAAYVVPDSGISEHDVVNTLLGRLDGPQSRAALGGAVPELQRIDDSGQDPIFTAIYSALPGTTQERSALGHHLCRAVRAKIAAGQPEQDQQAGKDAPEAAPAAPFISDKAILSWFPNSLRAAVANRLSVAASARPQIKDSPLFKALKRLECAAHNVYVPPNPSIDEWDELRLSAQLAREVMESTVAASAKQRGSDGH